MLQQTSCQNFYCWHLKNKLLKIQLMNSTLFANFFLWLDYKLIFQLSKSSNKYVRYQIRHIFILQDNPLPYHHITITGFVVLKIKCLVGMGFFFAVFITKQFPLSKNSCYLRPWLILSNKNRILNFESK